MAVFNLDKVSWAIEHLYKFHDTDIFPRLFEFKAIKECIAGATSLFKNKDICQWETGALRKFLVPKQLYGFRIATQLDPMDMIAFMSIVLEIGPEIESRRIHVNKNVVFSNRFQPDDTTHLFFNNKINYLLFRDYCIKKAEEANYVVETDISDFYQRIYFHRLENSLAPIRARYPDHVSAIVKLIKSWNDNISYGIPIGNNASRLLAELVISDIDNNLIAQKIDYCRYVDDYKFFCKTKKDAYNNLVFLANILYSSHGLTLSEQKTRIISSEEYVNELCNSEEKIELDRLADEYQSLLISMGIGDLYNPIDYEKLSEEEKKALNSLNLFGLLQKQLNEETPNFRMVKFIVNRLSQIQDPHGVDLLLSKIDCIHPVFSEVINYLANIVPLLPDKKREEIGALLLDSIDNSMICALPFNKLLILGLFAGSNYLKNQDKFINLYDKVQDDSLKRCLILASGLNSQDYWLRLQKGNLKSMSPWVRRAFIYSCSCLPKDEMKNYYSAIAGNLSNFEKLIIEYAKKNPITNCILSL